MPSMDPEKAVIDDPTWLPRELGLKWTGKATSERVLCVWLIVSLGTATLVTIFIVIPSHSEILILLVLMACLIEGIFLLMGSMKTRGALAARPFRLGELQLSSGNLDGAIEQFKLAITINPVHVPSRKRLAQAYQRAGDMSLAVKIIDELVRSNPTSRELLWTMDELLREANDTKRAVTMMREYLALAGQVDQKYGDKPHLHVLLQETRALILDRLGIWLIEQRNFKEAEQCLEESIHLFPGDTPAWISLSRLLIGRKDYANAIKLLREALDVIPGHDMARVIIAECYFKTGEAEKANQVMNEVIIKNPANVDVWNGMALVYEMSGLFQQALDAALKAKSIDRKNPWAWMNHGEALVNLDRYEEAIDVATSGLRYQDMIFRSVSYKIIGVAHYMKHRLDASRAAFNKALQLNGKNTDAHLGVLIVCLRKGETAGARAKVDDIIAFEPGSYLASYANGLCLLVEGKKEEAIQKIQDAIDKHPLLKVELKKEPLLDPIRQDPRFLALLKR